MTLKDIVSVSGISGLKKVAGQRKDGLIVSDLDGSNKKFLASRTHMFSPLDNISIYTDDNDTVPLPDVVFSMKEQIVQFPLPDHNDSNEVLRAYFLKVMPGHSEEKVKISDIKKLIKWYHILEEHGLIVPGEAAVETTEEEAALPKEEVPATAPKPKRKKKA